MQEVLKLVNRDRMQKHYGNQGYYPPENKYITSDGNIEYVFSFHEETTVMHPGFQVWEKISHGWKVVKILRVLLICNKGRGVWVRDGDLSPTNITLLKS